MLTQNYGQMNDLMREQLTTLRRTVIQMSSEQVSPWPLGLSGSRAFLFYFISQPVDVAALKQKLAALKQKNAQQETINAELSAANRALTASRASASEVAALAANLGLDERNKDLKAVRHVLLFLF